MLVSDALVDELAETLIERGISQERVIEFLALLGRLAEWVDVPDEAVEPVIEADPDDDFILACAVVGGADYLVTYDAHFDVLHGEHRGVHIGRALPFLRAMREGKPLRE